MASIPVSSRANGELTVQTDPAAVAQDVERDAKAGAAAGDGGEPPRSAAMQINAGQRPECFKNTFQEVGFVTMATLAAATSSFLAGTSVVIVASIGRDLRMTQGEISWISASNTLTAGSFQLALAQLADLLGRRALFLLGMASFSAGSLVVSFARNPFWMDILCGVLGLASAMVVPPAIGIMGAAYGPPSKRKNMAFSAFSAGNPIGFVFGSIFCGIAARLFDWRAAFILLAILWAIFAVVAFWFVPKVEAYASDQTVRQRFHGAWEKFDIVGTILTIFGTGMFTAALTLAPTDGWGSAHIIALLVVGIILLVIFVFWERVFANPLMPPHIWSDRNFSLIIPVVILGSMAFTSSNFWLAFYMQEYQGLDSLTVALHLLPQAIAGIIWNIVAGRILHKVNNTLIAAVGAAAYLTADLLLALMPPGSSYWAFIFPSLVINVIGADFQFNIANMYVMQSLPSHQQSTAGGIFNTLVRLGSTIALGISTAVYTSTALTDASMADPFLKYKRAFLVSVGLAGASILFLPFLRIGTQGGSPPPSDTDGSSVQESIPKTEDKTEKS